jgi:molybdopterin converting factor small subunit
VGSKGWAGYSGRMRVRLLYFGVLTDLLGGAEDAVELPEGADVGELLSILRARPSKGRMEERAWESLAVAVNREYAAAGVVLREGDEVALLPPVSGGCCAHGYSRHGCCAHGGSARVARKKLSPKMQWGGRHAH